MQHLRPWAPADVPSADEQEMQPPQNSDTTYCSTTRQNGNDARSPLVNQKTKYAKPLHGATLATLEAGPGSRSITTLSDAILIRRWRDGRVAEGARLESVFTLTGNLGSNPSLSAIPFS